MQENSAYQEGQTEGGGVKSEHEPLKEEASRRSTLNLDYCGDDQGNVETMKIDILTGRHKQAWLEMKTGSFREELWI